MKLPGKTHSAAILPNAAVAPQSHWSLNRNGKPVCCCRDDTIVVCALSNGCQRCVQPVVSRTLCEVPRAGPARRPQERSEAPFESSFPAWGLRIVAQRDLSSRRRRDGQTSASMPVNVIWVCRLPERPVSRGSPVRLPRSIPEEECSSSLRRTAGWSNRSRWPSGPCCRKSRSH